MDAFPSPARKDLRVKQKLAATIWWKLRLRRNQYDLLNEFRLHTVAEVYNLESIPIVYNYVFLFMPELQVSTATRFPDIKFGTAEFATTTPSWFKWAYSFGRGLARHRQQLSPGLIVITSPCQSPLVGAIALGTLVKLLETQIYTVDNDRHFETLFALRPGTLVKKKDKSRSRPRVFKLLRKRSREGGIQMKQVKGPKKFADAYIYLTLEIALSYVLESEDTTDPKQVHSLAPYPGASIIEMISSKVPASQTWRNNIDEIVLSGPTGGNASPKKQLISTSIVNDEGEGIPLHELLAVREWKDESRQTPHYSRFLNSSKAKTELPEIVRKSKYVFFNSIDSFIRFTDRFETQTQVLTCSRDVDSNKTDRLFGKLYAYKERATPFPDDVIRDFRLPPFGLQLFFYGSKARKAKKW